MESVLSYYLTMKDLESVLSYYLTMKDLESVLSYYLTMKDLLTDAKISDKVHQIMFFRKGLLAEIQHALRTIMLEPKTVKELIAEAEKAERTL